MEFLEDLWPREKQGRKESEELSEKTRNKIMHSIAESRHEYLNPFAHGFLGETRRFDELEQFEYEIRKQNGYGTQLPHTKRGLKEEALGEYLINCTTDEFLQAIEIYAAMKIENIETRSFPIEPIKKFIEDFNKIMSIDSCRYRLEINKVILVDSKLQYEELIKPVLEFLSDPKYENANNEFRRALEHQRKGRDSDNEVERDSAIREANNAFESVMKVGVGKDNLTAEQLITECKKRGDIPPQYENVGVHITRIFQVLPNIRSQISNAHGKGNKKSQSSDREVGFAINLAATFIIYIANK